MNNVIKLCPENHRFDGDVTEVIEGALQAGLKEIIVMGVTKDGIEFFATSKAYAPDIVWALERLKMRLLSGDVLEG